MPDAAIPVLLALGAACLFGASTATAKRGLSVVHPQAASLVVIGTVVALYLLVVSGVALVSLGSATG